MNIAVSGGVPHGRSQSITQGGPSVDLRDYFRILRRNWIWITTFSLLGILCGGAASILVQPRYTSETQLFVAIQNSGSVQELQQGNTFSQARVASYVRTVSTPLVLQPAIDRLGLNVTSQDLAGRVQASTDLDTVLINISVTDSSAVQAAATAQAVADSLVEAIDNLERPKTGGSSPVKLSIVSSTWHWGLSSGSSLASLFQSSKLCWTTELELRLIYVV
jgi:capsular polysaccharide biosynthesis protein